MQTLDTLVVQERALYLSAEKRLGQPYRMAREAVILTTTFIPSVDHNQFAFTNFMAIMKKHLTLALLSVIRCHHVQAMMNLRQVLETASNAAYALAHPGDLFIDQETQIALGPSRVQERSYKWVSREFPIHSADLQGAKDQINDNDAHSNIANASRLVDIDLEAGVLNTAFFDEEDAWHLTTDLVLITQAALCAMHLLVSVHNKCGGFVLAPDWASRCQAVFNDCERIKATVQQGDRYEKAMVLSERVEAVKAARRAKSAPKQKPATPKPPVYEGEDA